MSRVFPVTDQQDREEHLSRQGQGSIFKRPKPDSVQSHLPVSGMIKITKMSYPLGIDVN